MYLVDLGAGKVFVFCRFLINSSRPLTSELWHVVGALMAFSVESISGGEVATQFILINLVLKFLIIASTGTWNISSDESSLVYGPLSSSARQISTVDVLSHAYFSSRLAKLSNLSIYSKVRELFECCLHVLITHTTPAIANIDRHLQLKA